MYLTHNEGKPVVAERFIRTLNNKEYKNITSISKNVFVDKLDDIVNTYHKTIKIKSVDVKWSTYIDSSKEINDENPIFKVGHTIRISKHKNFFAKVYVPNRSDEAFAIKKVKKYCAVDICY